MTRITTSEPRDRGALSQRQRERMGGVEPIRTTTHSRVEVALTMLIALAVSIFFIVKVSV